jgi:hypothetical protein
MAKTAKKNKQTNNNLNLSVLKEKNKEKYGEQIEVMIDGYSVKIDKVWKPTKINLLFKELIKVSKDLSNKDSEVWAAYVYLLMFRHFTSLPIPAELDKQLDWLDELVDAGYFGQLVEALPKNEIEKVNSEGEKIANNINKNMDYIIEQAKKIELENEEAGQLVSGLVEDKKSE